MTAFDPAIVHSYKRDRAAELHFRRRWAIPGGVAVLAIAGGMLSGCVFATCGQVSSLVPIALFTTGGIAVAVSAVNYYRTASCSGCGVSMQHHRVPISSGYDHIYVCHACRKYFGYTVEIDA